LGLTIFWVREPLNNEVKQALLFSGSLIPVGRYRLNCRLEYAHDLLISGTVNVSECAWGIGYNNISHFVSVFKKRFVITPGSLLAHRKNASSGLTER
jgi:AraC-like DNA-binding protein